MRLTIGVFCLLLSHVALTQEMCVKLAEVIATETTTIQTDTQAKALNYYASCDASKSAKSDSFEIGYKAFNLGGTFDRKKATQLCKTSREESGIAANVYLEATRIFSRALDTIDRCITAANSAWDVNYQPLDRSGLILGIGHGNPLGGSLRGIQVLPPDSLSCNGIPDAFPKTVTNADPVNVTCSRVIETFVLGGVIVETVKAANLVLMLDNNPLPISLPAYEGTVFDVINEQISQLQDDVGALDTTVGGMGTKTSGTQYPLVGPRRNGGGFKQCPPGHYVNAIAASGSVGGKYATDGISQITFMCAPLRGN